MNLAKDIDTKLFHMIGTAADELGYECYLIGGYVRDILLQRPTKDIDVVVVGDGIVMAKHVAKKWGKGVYLSVFKSYGTAQVKRGKVELEFVGARKESYHSESRNPVVEQGSLEDDQNRRDFTVNALALCLNKERFGELIDPFDGLVDMERKILRTPCDPNITFSDDPLRMMRAIRFATQLNFRIFDDTLVAIMRNRERIRIITKERIFVEMHKILGAPKPSIGLKLLSDVGLMAILYPELEALKGVDRRGERAHKDIFLHTLKVVDNVAERCDDVWLRWAALFHDVGKPATKQWDSSQGWTFHNHNFVGAKMIPGIFKRMKMPLKEPMKFVQKMVNLHMRPIVLSEDEVTDSAVRRLLFDAGEDIDKLMILCTSDITSANREKVTRFSNNFKLVQEKLRQIEEKDRIRNFQPPVDGSEIMDVFDLPPSAIVGELKTILKDAVLDGVIPNEHDAAYQLLIDEAAKRGLQPVRPRVLTSVVNTIVANDTSQTIKNEDLVDATSQDINHNSDTVVSTQKVHQGKDDAHANEIDAVRLSATSQSGKRKVFTDSERRMIVEQFLVSGLSMRKFVEKTGLCSYSSLLAWEMKFHK